MSRIRTIKPEFFTDEDLARLPPLYRLGFEGLWCHADKAGRLEDRPARLKVQILPYDDVSFEVVLDALVAARFVQRYSGPDGRAYLQIRSFMKHQRPRPDELESELPSPPSVTAVDTDSSLRSDDDATTQRLGKERKGKEMERISSRTASAQAIVDLWNQLVTAPIPQVTKLTTDRRAKLDARLKSFPALETWAEAITWVNGQDWCRASGKGDHPNWTASLDWLCKNDGVIQRALEKSATVPARPAEWVCLHDPHCGSAWRCHQRTQLDLARRGAS